MSITVAPHPGAKTALPAPPSTAIPNASAVDATPSMHSSVTHISAAGAAMARHARIQRDVDAVTTTPEIESGKQYPGTVKQIWAFGALIEIGSGKFGLLHVSDLSGNRHGRNDDAHDYLEPNQSIKVKVTKIDPERDYIWLGMPSTASD